MFSWVLVLQLYLLKCLFKLSGQAYIEFQCFGDSLVILMNG